MKVVKFGVIGCGLMGREFSSAVARWCHMQGMPLSKYAGCVTPAEVGYGHALFTAALKSQANGTTELVGA